jgi:hypothetical protein
MSSILDQVKSKYTAVAASKVSGANAGVRSVAEAFGYTPEQLARIPQDSHMGLSCGNPIATANLKPGEVLVDLGSGGEASTFCEAGFAAVQVIDTKKDLGVYAQAGDSGCCSGSCCEAPSASDLHDGIASLLSRYDINAFAASVQVYGIKN